MFCCVVMPAIPIYVKGGVWTNLEDQILKAAIQKYGSQSWNKVASLLQKKSGKQCQSRWNEFLNPQLNFEKWSTFEDTKLLRLAKQLPNQWRTIGELIGRTANVCIDRYNKLLDEQDSGVDVKAGDFMINADVQAAKQDNEELGDEEREMLAEARVRLVNTQGRKGTRKIRERMLEMSKRVAHLQKRRELKQAGIHTRLRGPKKKYDTQLDYNSDIVYEQGAVGGIYDTSREDKRMISRLKDFERVVEQKGLRGCESSQDRVQDGRKRAGGHGLGGDGRKRGGGYGSGADGTRDVDRQKKPRLELAVPGTTTKEVQSEIDTIRDELLKQKEKGFVFETQILDIEKAQAKHLVPNRSDSLLNQLFSQLPKPQNDFEIVLEDEHSPSDPVAYKPIETASPGEPKEADTDVLLPWSCESLQREDLVIPDPITHVHDEVDSIFNMHLNAKLSATFNHEHPRVLEYKENIQNLLPTEFPQETHPSVEQLLTHRPSPNILQTSIRDLHFSIEHMSQSYPLHHQAVNETTSISEELTSTLIPTLLHCINEHNLQYAKYQTELNAISHRKARLRFGLDL